MLLLLLLLLFVYLTIISFNFEPVRLNLKALAGLECWLESLFLLGATVPTGTFVVSYQTSEQRPTGRLASSRSAAPDRRTAGPARAAQPALICSAEQGLCCSVMMKDVVFMVS